MIEPISLSHHIQKYIIDVLMYVDVARFRDLRPPKTDTNLFTYHLNSLVKTCMVIKVEGGYALSMGGLSYVDRVSTEKKAIRTQPKEIAATLQLARELSDHVVLVYQPHQNRRQTRLQKDYLDQFELAEETYWLPTYLSREDPEEPILTPAELIATLTNKETIHIAELDDSLWYTIQKSRHQGKLVLCMGAGTIDSWVRERNAQ